MSSDPIRLRGLSHTFGTGTAQRQVLQGLDLSVAAGAFTMLMGPSGCGKTTVLTLAGGLRAVQSGSARILGTELNGATEATRLALRRRIGFIHQGHNLHASLTALGNIRMALEVHGTTALAGWRDRCAAALAAVGLADRGGAYPAELSTGQKQRVAIARALVGEPAILLADEPTGALDPLVSREIMGLFEEINQELGVLVLIITHDPGVAARCRRRLMLTQGRLAEQAALEHA